MADDRGKALAARALALLDLTNLEEQCTTRDVDGLCRRATTRFGSVAAVCLWPAFVRQAAGLLNGGPVGIATVVNFPHGQGETSLIVEEARQAVADGAGEIDLVMAYPAFKAGQRERAREQIVRVREALGGRARLKVILETGALQRADLIEQASVTAIEAGADFIKTSTGKIAVSATPEAAEIMLRAIKASGGACGFKAAGGIRSLADAGAYLALADSIMGEGWATADRFRFGASGLLNALVAELEGAAGAAEENGY